MDDDVRRLIEEGGWRPTPPQPTQAQMVQAYEWAMDFKAKHEDNFNFFGAGVERAMVQAQGAEIDEVQMEQRITNAEAETQPRQDDVMMEIEQYLWWQKDEAKKAKQAEQLKAVAKALSDAGFAFESAVKALGQALSDAMRPFQDLLDQLGMLPSEPSLISQPACPTHGRPLRGGRCSRCDLRDRNPGRTPGRR